jgi:glycosyltransferase involved in cell wall biosynthesis
VKPLRKLVKRLMDSLIGADSVKKPTVSIIIPTFNSNPIKTFGGLSSIRDQILNDFECLIIDDSLSNLTISLLKEFCDSDPRFFYFRGDGKGIANALNIGLSKAQGKYIARADDTDICAPHRLLRQVEYLERNSLVDIIGSNMSLIHSNGELGQRRYPQSHLRITKRFLISCPIAHPTVMLRRNIIDDGFRYDERFMFCEDLEYWLRLYRFGYKFFNLQEDLVIYEVQDGLRSTEHYQYNFKARLKHSWNLLILLSCILSLGHLFFPSGIREWIIKRYQSV